MRLHKDIIACYRITPSFVGVKTMAGFLCLRRESQTIGRFGLLISRSKM